MTAEIGIINNIGVALASDSAVTMRIGNNHKIFNSADKLFSLSKYAPVGIMIYGNAHFMGIPWETMIKVYRSHLSNNTFKKLEDYYTDFINFVQDQYPKIDPQDELMMVEAKSEWFFGKINEHIIAEVGDHLEENNSINRRETAIITKNVIDYHYKQCNTLNFIEGFDQQFIDKYINKFHDKLKEIIKKVFENNLPGKVGIEKLIFISSCLFSKEYFIDSSPAISGIVIAGFGEDEIFPALYSFQIEGIVCDKLVYIFDARKSKKSEDKSVAVLPFAQENVVNSFVEGIDPSLNRLIEESFSSVMEIFPDLIEGKLLPEIGKYKDKINIISNQLLEIYHKKIEEVIYKKHITPMLRVVSGLPKEELAIMAETLVHITSFKRRVTTDAETVGGPIDVAVITKGDGFIWIKRKHYFRQELNHQFFENYFREDVK